MSNRVCRTTLVKMLIIGSFSLILVSCNSNPVYTGDSDLSEFESVWQYLKVYSIYQERLDSISPTPFVYSSPELLLFNMHDTLKGAHYTKYGTITTSTAFQKMQVSQTNALLSTVVVTQLTDSTVRLTIQKFEKETWSDFLQVVPTLARYHNIIVDVSNNGGGLIESVDSIINAFLPPSTPYIRARYRDYDRSTHSARTIDTIWSTNARGPLPELTNKKLAVLMNSNSASASEILVAALKEGLNAPLFGERTYGKGIGQVQIPRRDRPALLITFLKLKGYSQRIGDYHRKGIVPDALSPSLLAMGTSFDTWESRFLWYALKSVEASATNLPVLYKSSAVPDGTSRGYKIVDEEF